MVQIATLSNISVISCLSVLLVDEIARSLENDRQQSIKDFNNNMYFNSHNIM